MNNQKKAWHTNCEVMIIMTLTQKETTLLQDLKTQEQLCVDKYSSYSAEASDGELKNLFSEIGRVEQNHLDTINQILGGSIPSMGSNQFGGSGQSVKSGITLGKDECCCSDNTQQNFKNDKYLCEDCLSTEKHVSSTYNTSIFEFKDPALRDTLNHLQKEEQEHGEQLFKYMEAHGMYQG